MRIVRFCAISGGSARGFFKKLKNGSRNFHKSIDGIFLNDIMRPLLLLRQESWGRRAREIELENNTD
jgi:hypothetical protein